MTYAKRSHKKQAKKKKKSVRKSGIFLLLCITLFSGLFAYFVSTQNAVIQRLFYKETAQTQTTPSLNVVKLEINEADTITTFAKKVAQRFPKLNMDESQIKAYLSDRTRIQALQKTYPFIPESVLDTTISSPLEGFFAPLTYEYYEDATLDMIIQKPLDAMYSFYQKYAVLLQQKGMSFYEGLILASIINAEVPTTDTKNMAMVAQVFINRLNDGIGLGSDVTLAYALNKKELTQADFTNNSSNLYNTRINKKLTPTPVQFVTSNAMDAVIQPTANTYYYFLTGTCPGRADYQQFFYATTYESHKKNIQDHMVC